MAVLQLPQTGKLLGDGDYWAVAVGTSGDTSGRYFSYSFCWFGNVYSFVSGSLLSKPEESGLRAGISSPHSIDAVPMVTYYLMMELRDFVVDGVIKLGSVGVGHFSIKLKC